MVESLAAQEQTQRLKDLWATRSQEKSTWKLVPVEWHEINFNAVRHPVCRNSRLMAGFSFTFWGSFTDARLICSLRFYFHPKWGSAQLKPKAQPRHRGILQASVASSPCPRTWENKICHSIQDSPVFL